MLNTKQIKKLEFVLYNEERIRESVREYREEKKIPTNSVSFAGIHSDPTGNNAVKNLLPIEKIFFGSYSLERPEEWLRIIEDTYKIVDVLTRQLAEDKYRRKKKYIEICLRHAVSKSVFYRRIKEFLEIIYLNALYSDFSNLFPILKTGKKGAKSVVIYQH